MIWNRTYSGIAMLFALIVLLFHVVFFPEYVMPLLILFAGFATILAFFIGLFLYHQNWIQTSFIQQKLFLHSLLYRLIGIMAMYALTSSFDPSNVPFDIDAIDSINYHVSGQKVAEALERGDDIFRVLSGFWKGKSDYGFSIVIGFLYYIFGAFPLIIQIFNALLGSLTVVRVYQITRYIYDEKRARLAGILMMLMPTLLWFSAMLLKETLLIFMIVNVAYLVIRFIYQRSWRIPVLMVMMFLVAFTLYFRTFMAPLLLTCIVLQLIFLKTTKKLQRTGAIIVAILLIYGSYHIVDQLGMGESIDSVVEASQSQFENELTNSAQTRGISYTKALVAPLLIGGAIVTPFPSLLDFERAQLGIYSHFHNEIVRNILYFFVFFGLFRIWKHRKKGTIFIASFAIGYILILAVSGVSFQDRFQVLALPFLIIFMADGITTPYPKKISHWKIYLLCIFVAILAWNLFKLSNRGLL